MLPNNSCLRYLQGLHITCAVFILNIFILNCKKKIGFSIFFFFNNYKLISKFCKYIENLYCFRYKLHVLDGCRHLVSIVDYCQQFLDMANYSNMNMLLLFSFPLLGAGLPVFLGFMQCPHKLPEKIHF